MVLATFTRCRRSYMLIVKDSKGKSKCRVRGRDRLLRNDRPAGRARMQVIPNPCWRLSSDKTSCACVNCHCCFFVAMGPDQCSSMRKHSDVGKLRRYSMRNGLFLFSLSLGPSIARLHRNHLPCEAGCSGDHFQWLGTS